MGGTRHGRRRGRVRAPRPDGHAARAPAGPRRRRDDAGAPETRRPGRSAVRGRLRTGGAAAGPRVRGGRSRARGGHVGRSDCPYGRGRASRRCGRHRPDRDRRGRRLLPGRRPVRDLRGDLRRGRTAAAGDRRGAVRPASPGDRVDRPPGCALRAETTAVDPAAVDPHASPGVLRSDASAHAPTPLGRSRTTAELRPGATHFASRSAPDRSGAVLPVRPRRRPGARPSPYASGALRRPRPVLRPALGAPLDPALRRGARPAGRRPGGGDTGTLPRRSRRRRPLVAAVDDGRAAPRRARGPPPLHRPPPLTAPRGAGPRARGPPRSATESPPGGRPPAVARRHERFRECHVPVCRLAAVHPRRCGVRVRPRPVPRPRTAHARPGVQRPGAVADRCGAAQLVHPADGLPGGRELVDADHRPVAYVRRGAGAGRHVRGGRLAGGPRPHARAGAAAAVHRRGPHP